MTQWPDTDGAGTGMRRRTLLVAAGAAAGSMLTAPAASAKDYRTMPTRAQTVARYSGQVPRQWGTAVPGVISRFRTDTRYGAGSVALTFDACGGRVFGYDAELIATLRRERVHATLFVNRYWAQANPRTFASLAASPLFEIANHGQRHVPLSVNGRSAYGITGTASVRAAYDEILYPQRWFNQAGVDPRWFRPGTAYADEVAASMARWIGMPLVGFSVNGDWGASATARQVADNLASAVPGDIVLCHFNHPGSGTAAGVARGIATLRARGIRFRRLRAVL